MARGDAYTMSQYGTLTVAAPGMLGNDDDADEEPVTAQLVSQPQGGTLVLNANGSFGFTPDEDFTGVTSFTYEDSDGLEDSGPVTVYTRHA